MRYCPKGFVDKKNKIRGCGNCKEINTCKKEQGKNARDMRGALSGVNKVLRKRR